MAVLLALCSALTYGLSDFIGGVLAKRANAWAVAASSQAAAALLAVALASIDAGSPDARSILWGVLGGLGSAAGNVFIYRGLARGRMAIVAPLSAIAAALLPIVVGLVMGERPGAFPVLGVLIAMPAIWLVSGGGVGLRAANREDAVNGLVAGTGFGVQFSALGQIPPEAGLTPLAVSTCASVIAIVACAAAMSEAWQPRDRYSRLGATAGLLAGIATVCFQLATQAGLLTIAAVLTSLYPAVTVLLAALVLGERIDRAQGIGLALAATAIALIASG